MSSENPVLDSASHTTNDELVTIRYKGKSYTVTTDVADAWNDRGEEASSTIRNDRAELARWRRGELRNDEQPRSQQPQKTKAERDVEILADPSTALENVKSEILQEQNKLQQQLIQQQIEKWWEEFYTDNPHLREKDEFLRSIAMNEATSGRWQELNNQEAQHALVTLADKAGWVRPQSDTDPAENPRDARQRRVLPDTPVQTERASGSRQGQYNTQRNQQTSERSEVASVMDEVRAARLKSRFPQNEKG